jgi:hypothetical protein
MELKSLVQLLPSFSLPRWHALLIGATSPFIFPPALTRAVDQRTSLYYDVIASVSRQSRGEQLNTRGEAVGHRRGGGAKMTQILQYDSANLSNRTLELNYIPEEF